MQAVRVNLRWTNNPAILSAEPCSDFGGYNDVDDLAFAVEVKPTTPGPTNAPTNVQTNSPTTTSTKIEGEARYDPVLGVPKCGYVTEGGKCSTAWGTGLLNCKKVTGEQNGPNTLDTCTDGGSGSCGSDESIEDITITSSSGKLSAGTKAKVKATIYAWHGS